ncbi:MAG: S-layer homology domain-containing protein [Caldisericia bacterium]|nr:S-layer homology domain-containing protein [Caldisericia bacterium]
MKKLLAVAVVFFLILIQIPKIESIDASQSFVDVPQSHWAYEAIHYMADMGIVTGYPDGTFRPEKAILRQEMAVIAYKILGFDGLRPSKPTFSDVPQSHWAYPVIETIGISKLMEDTSLNARFRPEQNLERIEYVPFQCRVLGMKYFAQHMTNEDVSGTLARYSDNRSIPNWARNYLAILTESKSIGGFPDGTFKPFQPLTRAQICVSFYNMIKPLAPNEPVATPAKFNVVVNGALMTPFLSTNLKGALLEFKGKAYSKGYVSLLVNGVPFMPNKVDVGGQYSVNIPIGIVTIGGITIQAKYFEENATTPKNTFQAYSSVPFDLFPSAFRIYALEYIPTTRRLSYVSEVAVGNMLLSVENTTTKQKVDIAPKAAKMFTISTVLNPGANHVNLVITNKEKAYRLIYGFDFNSN